MANSIGLVQSSIWTSEFTQLTGDAQRLYLFLISQDDVNLCGVLALRINRWAVAAADLTPAKVRKALAELERARFVVIDQTTEELLIRTFVKYSGALKLPNVIVGVMKQYGLIRSGTLRRTVLEGLPLDIQDRTKNCKASAGTACFDAEWQAFPNGSGNRLANPSAQGSRTVAGTVSGTDADTQEPRNPGTCGTLRPSDEVNVGGNSTVSPTGPSDPPAASHLGLRQALAAGNRNRIGVGA